MKIRYKNIGTNWDDDVIFQVIAGDYCSDHKIEIKQTGENVQILNQVLGNFKITGYKQHQYYIRKHPTTK